MGIADKLKSLSGMGADSVQAGGAIGQKTRMIQEYKDATSGASQPEAPKAPSAPATPNPATQYGTRKGEKRFKLGKDGEILGQYKKGGKVKKTGVYKLHKSERVLNPKQTKKFEKVGGLKALAGKMAKPSSFKDGGMVQKTGLAKVHAGEMVIPKMHITRIISNPNGIRPLKDTDSDVDNPVQRIPTTYKKPPVGVPGADVGRGPNAANWTRQTLREQ